MMEKGGAIYREDGSDDPDFERWKQLQRMSWMLAVPSGKSGYQLYQGEKLRKRERDLQRAIDDEKRKEEKKERDAWYRKAFQCQKEEAEWKAKIASETKPEKQKALKEDYAHANWESHGRMIQEEREEEKKHEEAKGKPVNRSVYQNLFADFELK